MTLVSSLVVSDSHPMSFSKLGFSGSGVFGSDVELCSVRFVGGVSSRSVLLKRDRDGGEMWVWKGRGGVLVRCGGDEGSDSSVGEAGSKRRPARTDYSGAQRIERAQEATKRRALARGSRKLYTRSLLVSLHERIKQNHWVPALEVFKLVREQEWYVPVLSTYLQLLTLLAKVRQPAEALSLFDSLLEDNLKPTTAIFTALLTVLTKTNHFRKAVVVFESMRLYQGCVPDKYTYTAMIKGCCEAGLYDQARKIFDEMILEGVKPTIVTFNTLIFGYGKSGRFRDIERVLTLMESYGVAPDTVTWNTLIRVFGLHNRITEMEQAYEGILAQGLRPDVVTLNSLISAYGTAGLFEKMRSVTDFMVRYGYPMTTVTYNIVIETYGKAGEIDQMDMAFEKMEAEGVKPNRATFCFILSAYGQHGHWHNVDRVMQQAKEYDAVNTSVYNAAIDAYRRAHNFEEMEKMYDEMKLEGLAPDDVTFSILIDAYKRVMRLEKVQQLQEEWDALTKQSAAE
ncbi:hypothetical protein KC19_3G137500 [Ceratodon purpureus]|uniref:Pentatricopeptide repeat-containing protein n=1 Tax=Ceratodon purpureus TaxID=3225 RepID=A0A8T0IKQ7_CERPU|nr:hypothetical protein KC19_3G137500 [Ceratodon purpureus]